MKQRTILIPIYNGVVGRNFFRTDVYRELIRDPAIRIVAVIPSSKIDFYRMQFPEKNLVWEPLDGISEPRLGQVLNGIAFNLLPTRTIWFRQKDRYLKYGNYPNFIFKRVLNVALGHFQFPRTVIRWCDRFVSSDLGVSAVLKRYQPDLLLVPDVAFGVDRVFLRAAKRTGIATLGMVRSWDNLTSKGVIQILPDRLMVHTDRMKRQAVRYAGMREEDIVVTGPPGYDEFFRPRAITREAFFRSIGVDPKKRLILFAPFFDRYTGSAIAMINGLVDAIESGKLPRDIHMLIRYRPAVPHIPEGQLHTSVYVSESRPCEYYFPIKTKLMLSHKDWEFSEDDMQRLLNSLYFSDCIINTFSTLTIDGAAFDKPSIGIRFDADPNCPPLHSVISLADRHDHYRELEALGGVRLVYSMDDLVHAINAYLKNPALDREGRKRICEEQIQFFDGRSGTRVVRYIKQILAEKD